MKEITLELRGQNAPEAVQKLESVFSDLKSADRHLGDSNYKDSGINSISDHGNALVTEFTNQYGGFGSVTLSKDDHSMTLKETDRKGRGRQSTEGHIQKMLETYKSAGINPETIQLREGSSSVLAEKFDGMKKEVFGNSPEKTAQTQATRAATSAPTPPQSSTTPKSTTTAPAAVTASAPSETATGAKPTAPTTQPSTPPPQNTGAAAYYDKSGQLLWIHSPDSMLPKKNTPGALDDKGMYQMLKGNLVLPGKPPTQEELNSLTKVPFKTNAHSVKNEYDKWNPMIQKDANNAFQAQKQEQQTQSAAQGPTRNAGITNPRPTTPQRPTETGGNASQVRATPGSSPSTGSTGTSADSTAAVTIRQSTGTPEPAAIAHETSPRVLARAKTVLNKAAKSVGENATIDHNFKPSVWGAGEKAHANAVEKAGNHFIAMAKAHHESGRENPLNLEANPQKKTYDLSSIDPATAGLGSLVTAYGSSPMEGEEKKKFLDDVRKYVDDRLSSDEKKNVSINGQALATPPQMDMGATASAAEAESEEEEHPTYTHMANPEKQEEMNKTLEGSGYKFATDEEGNVHLHGPDETKISINKDGSYSGTTIPFEEIKPDHPQYQNSVDKMERDMKAIIKAHESGPNAGEPLDLNMGLSEEEMKENPQFVKDVQARLNKSLTEDQKKTITFDGKKIEEPVQDKTASLSATGQTPSATPAQSTTPTPSPQPGGSAKEAEETMTCEGYYDNKGRVSHVNIPSGPQAGWYENKAEVGDAKMEKLPNGKPDHINDSLANKELHQMNIEYPLNQREASLTNLSATTALTNVKRMEGATPSPAPGQEAAQANNQTNISNLNPTPTELTTRANKDISAELQNNESNTRFANLHTQINNDANLRESLAKEGGQSQNGGFSLLTRGKDQAGESYATLRNTDNGQHIDIKQDGGMKGSMTPPSKANSNEATADHHANIFKGMLAAMSAMGGKDPINAVFTLMQGNSPLGAGNPVAQMVMGMLKEHLDKNPALKDMVSNMSLNGENIHHNKDAKRPEKKAHHGDEHKGHHKEKNAHAPKQKAHAAKPKPDHGSHKHEDENHPSKHNAHQSLKPRGKGGGGA